MAKNKQVQWKSKIVGHDRVPASQLLANPYNHRRHPQQQRDVVAASIGELGFIKSVIVNRTTGHIVDGHERVMQALGVSEETLVDVEYVELSPEDEKKALLILDASSELAEVDAADVNALVQECAWENEVLSKFCNEAFSDMLDKPEITPEADDAPTLEESPTRSKAGDLWILGDHRLLCGDSTKPQDVLRLFAGLKSNLMLTDPPYNVDYTGGTKDALKVKNDNMEDAKFRQFLVDCFKQAFAVMDSGAAFYIFHADSEGYNFRGAVHDCNEKVRQCLIWIKNALVLGRQDYQWQHEPCLVGVKESELQEPEVDPECSKHEPCLYGWKRGASHGWYSDRRQTTLLHFDRPKRSAEHPTMKPAKMIGYLMSNSTVEREIVYDPFLGSGTTLIAAEQLNRRCFGLELDPRYCDVIIHRWEMLTKKQAVLAET